MYGQTVDGGELLSHHFDDHPFPSPAVELRVVDLLPGAEIEVARRHGDDDFVVNQEALQVGVAVRLARA